MPGHGDHWEKLYSAEDYVQSKISRGIQEGQFVGSADCMDVEDGTDRPEQVMCLRWGTDRLANQILVVSNSAKQSNFLFSGYPIVLDGAPTEVTISKVEAWEYGIEGWVHGSVTSEGASICFFDTMYFAGTAGLKEGDVANYQLAGLAYWLRRIQLRSFEVREGVIEAIDTFEHDGQKVYRLQMVLMRPGDEEFRIPVYASERALDGYEPRLGEDVEGVMWVQGRRNEADAALGAQHPGKN